MKSGTALVDPADSSTWPDETIVVRGGEGAARWLARTVSRDGTWSVQAHPGTSFDRLASRLPHARVRRTTLGAVRLAGGNVVASRGPTDYHCDVEGMSAQSFDSILGAPEDNPAEPG